MACRQSVIGLILLGLSLIPATFSSIPVPTTTPPKTLNTTQTGSVATQIKTTVNSSTSQTTTSNATPAKESTTTTTTDGPSSTSTIPTTTTTSSSSSSTPTTMKTTTPGAITHSPSPALTILTTTTTSSSSSSTPTTKKTTTQGKTTRGSFQSSPTPTTVNPDASTSTGAPSSTTTTASAATKGVTGTTSTPPSVSATTKAATAVSSTTTTEAPPTMPKILINEFTLTGLFSSGPEFFVELIAEKLGNVSENLTVVVMDGETDLKCQGIEVVNSTWTKNLTVVNMTLEKKDDRKSVVVALYATDAWANCVDYEQNTTADVMDVMVVGKSSKTVNISDVKERFNLLGTFNVLVVDESNLKLHGKYSVSRCEQTAMNVGSFVVAEETKDQDNHCTIPINLTQTLYFNASADVTCTSFNKETKNFLKNYIAKNVGDNCSCGLSPNLISLGKCECNGMMQRFSIGAITKDQLIGINKSFTSTMKVNTCLKNDSICLTSPGQNCVHHPQPSKKGKINVTVAVVITCIVVFLVIVFVVIIYIRRKRRGILQFRMTRLNEDDDDLIGQDTDDFVGSQDASFSNSSYSRFQ